VHIDHIRTFRPAHTPGSPLLLAALLALLGAAPRLAAQGAGSTPLTVRDVREAARQSSPDLRALREAAAAAAGRERQAGAWVNPSVAYGHERTSKDGATNAQHIAQLEQPLELGGQRGARRDAARLRREAAEARVVAAQARLDHEVTRAYALAVAADRRAQLAAHAAAAFVEAERVSAQRLAAGDVSGYADRRLKLEAARYAGQRAAAALARRTARLALATLITSAPDTLADRLVLADSALLVAMTETLPARVPARVPARLAADSLQRFARTRRADLRALAFEQEAMVAEARVAERERIPVPTLAAGYKTEEAAGGGDGFNGFVVGFSLPLPLWDRRRGAVEAAEAEARRADAERIALERQVAREVAEAIAALEAIETELALLAPHVGERTRVAMNAVRVAYAEGDISLLEWLDAVRAYQEAEATYASLVADVLVRRAALERAVGGPLFE
jgi:cobalt-zinc-cadmium efflux system outer membrane protein